MIPDVDFIRCHTRTPSTSRTVSSGACTLTVRGSLGRLSPPQPFMCIVQSWPSQLVTLLLLKLDVVGAYFPKRFHSVLAPLNPKVPFQELHLLDSSMPHECIFLISRSSSFVSRHLRHPSVCHHAIVHVEMQFRDFPGKKMCKQSLYLSSSVCGRAGLTPVFFSHFEHGEATDALYTIGIGHSVDPSSLVRQGYL